MAIGHRRVVVHEDSGKTYESEIFLPNIRNIIGFLEGTWDLKMYDDCFEGKSKLGDIDASIELHGHTLLLEFKRNRESLTAGQVVKAIRQARHSNITTFFVFGETNRPTEVLIFSPNNIDGSGIMKANTSQLRQLLKNWNRWAKKNSLIDAESEADWRIAKKYLNAVGGGKK